MEILDLVRRKKKALIISVVSCLVVAVLILVFVRPSYTSKTKFIVRDNTSQFFMGQEGVGDIVGAIGIGFVEAQNILNSYDFLNSIADSLYLDSVYDLPREKTVDRLQRKLDVSPVLKSNIIELSLSSDDPENDVLVLRQVIDEYNRTYLYRCDSALMLAMDALDKKYFAAESAYLASNAAMRRYQIENQYNGNDADRYVGQRESYYAQKLGLESQRAIADKIHTIVSDDKHSLLPINVEMSHFRSDAVEGIKLSNLGLLVDDYNSLALQSVQNDSTRSALRLKRANILSCVELLQQSLDVAYKDVCFRYNRALKRLRELPDYNQEWKDMSRENGIIEQSYNFFYAKREKLRIYYNTLSSQLQIIDAPYTDLTTKSPRKSWTLIIFFVLGCVIPFTPDIVRWIPKLLSD